MFLQTDSYIVVNKNVITDYDKKILIDLYQPVIGATAIILYLTLLNDLEKNEIISTNYTHHHLLTTMQISINEIKIAKEKLEAIGLLKTYLKEDSINNIIYILYAPISPSEFLNHPILNIVLYSNVGKERYQILVNSYKVPKINLKEYKDITKQFDEVFTSVTANDFIVNDNIIKNQTKKIDFTNNYDFDLLLSGISSKIINEKALTSEVKNLIVNLSYIYNIDVLSMQNIIKACLNEKGNIEKETLRKNARNYYKFENNSLPTIVYKKEAKKKTVVNKANKKQTMLDTFENTHPYTFLKSKYKDGKIVQRDLSIIENLLIDLKLEAPVVNVLIDYVLKINNQKLSKNFIETIASQWKRLGIKTASDAMQECIKHHKDKTTTTTKKNQKQSTNLPLWFDKEIEKQELTKQEEEELKQIINSYS